jgi:type IV secretory pathway VirB3-like protein
MSALIARVVIAMIMGVAMAGVVMVMIVTMAIMLPVTVIMAVMVLVIMLMVATMGMGVGMIMLMRAAVIGLEWRHHRGRLEASFIEQQRSRGVREHAQAIGEDLDGNVAIAQRQQQARRPGEILLANLQHRLGIGDHLDEMAVVEHQAIIGAQQR